MYRRVIRIDKKTGETEEVNSINFIEQAKELSKTTKEVNIGLITIFYGKDQDYHAYRYG